MHHQIFLSKKQGGLNYKEEGREQAQRTSGNHRHLARKVPIPGPGSDSFRKGNYNYNTLLLPEYGETECVELKTSVRLLCLSKQCRETYEETNMTKSTNFDSQMDEIILSWSSIPINRDK